MAHHLTERHPETAAERYAYALALAGDWCGGNRSPEEVRAEQLTGGNGPNPDWASSSPTRTAPAPVRKRRARRAAAKRFHLDDITREEPPSMRRHVTERPAAA